MTNTNEKQVERKRILIGDDKQKERTSLARALGNYNLTFAEAPDEVINKARQSRYDLIITDLEYTEGGKEGFQVLREIKDLSEKRILYTGRRGFEMVMEGIFAGATEVVEGKNLSQLLEIVSELNSKRENTELKGGERK